MVLRLASVCSVACSVLFITDTVSAAPKHSRSDLESDDGFLPKRGRHLTLNEGPEATGATGSGAPAENGLNEGTEATAPKETVVLGGLKMMSRFGGLTDEDSEDREIEVELLKPEETVEEALEHLRYYGYCSLLPFLKDEVLSKLLLAPNQFQDRGSPVDTYGGIPQEIMQLENTPWSAVENTKETERKRDLISHDVDKPTLKPDNKYDPRWGMVRHRGFGSGFDNHHGPRFHVDSPDHRLNFWFPLPEKVVDANSVDFSEDPQSRTLIGLKGYGQLTKEDVVGMYDGQELEIGKVVAEDGDAHASMDVDVDHSMDVDHSSSSSFRKVLLLLRPRLASEKYDTDGSREHKLPAESEKIFEDHLRFRHPRFSHSDESATFARTPFYESVEGFKAVTYTHGPMAFAASVLPHAGAVLHSTNPSKTTVSKTTVSISHSPLWSQISHKTAPKTTPKTAPELFSCELRALYPFPRINAFHDQTVISADLLPTVFKASGMCPEKWVKDTAVLNSWREGGVLESFKNA
jgi:hypothetical protein